MLYIIAHFVMCEVYFSAYIYFKVKRDSLDVHYLKML